VTDTLSHVSEQPWSNYTKADYSNEQWHSACLIHQHEGTPTSKSQCKLPVKTPDGTLNRNGVHAAAAALAGARGGVDASPEEKEKAARALRGYYKQLDEEPPESLTHKETFENFLSHFGVKGMRWGVRRDTSSSGEKRARGFVRRGATKANVAFDASVRAAGKGEKEANLIFLPQRYRDRAATRTHAAVLSSAIKLNRTSRFKGKDIKRNKNLKYAYRKELEKKGLDIYRREIGRARGEAVADFVKGVVNPDLTSITYSVPQNTVRHADDGDEVLLILKLTTNDLGHVVGVEIDKDSLKHGDLEVELAHYGVKGMRWGVSRTRAQIDADSEDVTKVKTAKAVISKNRGSTDPLSNKELQDVVTRMNLEQQYSRLSARPSKPAVLGKRLQTGMKVVNGVLSAGESANKAITFVNSPAGKKLKDQFEKK